MKTRRIEERRGEERSVGLRFFIFNFCLFWQAGGEYFDPATFPESEAKRELTRVYAKYQKKKQAAEKATTTTSSSSAQR